MPPGEMLQKMKMLAGPQAQDDNLLRRMWFSRLSEPIKLQLQSSIDSGDLTTLARWADSLHSIQMSEARKKKRMTPVTYAVAAAAEEDPRDRRIAELEAAVARLSMGAINAPVEAQPICWYHQTFKHAATKCRPPCKFHKSFTKKKNKKTMNPSVNA